MDPTHPTRALVEALCSDACAGRRPGTPGGLLARRLVMGSLRDAGLDPHERPAPLCQGANVVATIPGDIDRWVLVGAHYDHLGSIAGASTAAPATARPRWACSPPSAPR